MYRPPLIREDWANHFIWTQLVSLVTYIFSLLFFRDHAVLLALGAGIIVAVAWEILQHTNKQGEASKEDAIAGILGSIILLTGINAPIALAYFNLS